MHSFYSSLLILSVNPVSLAHESQQSPIAKGTALAIPEPCTSSSKRSGNIIGGSISGGSSFGASTGTTISENSARHSQKMNTVSILVQSGIRNPERMNAVRI